MRGNEDVLCAANGPLADRLAKCPEAVRAAVADGVVGFARVRLNWMRAVRLSLMAMPSTAADDGYTCKTALAAGSRLNPRPWAALQDGTRGVEVIGWRLPGAPSDGPVTDPALRPAGDGVVVDERETLVQIKPGTLRWMLLANPVASPSDGERGSRRAKRDIGVGLSGAQLAQQYGIWARRRLCSPGLSMPLVGEPGGPVLVHRELVTVSRKSPLPPDRVTGKQPRVDAGGRITLQHDAVRVILTGTLVVEDPAVLARKLLEGMGASKAFGCGMLMLDVQPGGLPEPEALLPGAVSRRGAMTRVAA